MPRYAQSLNPSRSLSGADGAAITRADCEIDADERRGNGLPPSVVRGCAVRVDVVLDPRLDERRVEEGARRIEAAASDTDPARGILRFAFLVLLRLRDDPLTRD